MKKLWLLAIITVWAACKPPNQNKTSALSQPLSAVRDTTDAGRILNAAEKHLINRTWIVAEQPWASIKFQNNRQAAITIYDGETDSAITVDSTWEAVSFAENSHQFTIHIDNFIFKNADGSACPPIPLDTSITADFSLNATDSSLSVTSFNTSGLAVTGLKEDAANIMGKKMSIKDIPDFLLSEKASNEKNSFLRFFKKPSAAGAADILGVKSLICSQASQMLQESVPGAPKLTIRDLRMIKKVSCGFLGDDLSFTLMPKD